MRLRLFAALVILALTQNALAASAEDIRQVYLERYKLGLLKAFTMTHLATKLAEELGGSEAASLAGKSMEPRFREAAELATDKDAPAAAVQAVPAELYEKAKIFVQAALAETKDEQNPDFIWAPVPQALAEIAARASWRAMLEGKERIEKAIPGSLLTAKTPRARLLKAGMKLIPTDADFTLLQQTPTSVRDTYIEMFSYASTFTPGESQERDILENALKTALGKAGLTQAAWVIPPSWQTWKLWPTREDRIEQEIAKLLGFLEFIDFVAWRSEEDKPEGNWPVLALTANKTLRKASAKLGYSMAEAEFKLYQPIRKFVFDEVAKAKAQAVKEKTAIDQGQVAGLAAWRHALARYSEVISDLWYSNGDPQKKPKGIVLRYLLGRVDLQHFQKALLVERVFYLLSLQHIINHFDEANRNELLPVFWAFLEKPEVEEATEHFYRILDAQTAKKSGPIYKQVFASVPVSADVANLMAGFAGTPRFDWDKVIPLLQGLLEN